MRIEQSRTFCPTARGERKRRLRRLHTELFGRGDCDSSASLQLASASRTCRGFRSHDERPVARSAVRRSQGKRWPCRSIGRASLLRAPGRPTGRPVRWSKLFRTGLRTSAHAAGARSGPLRRRGSSCDPCPSSGPGGREGPARRSLEGDAPRREARLEGRQREQKATRMSASEIGPDTEKTVLRTVRGPRRASGWYRMQNAVSAYYRGT